MILPGWLVRVLPYVAAIAGGAIGILWVRGDAYDEGYAARESEVAAIARAHERIVAGANERIAAAAQSARDDVQRELDERPAKVRTVTEVVRENPDFAAVRRPDKLHAQRVRELDEISAAARARR
jgi:hypothetical protein